MAGRGAGKSFAMNHDAAHYAWTRPNHIVHMIAPTADDLRKVTFEGPSGLLSIIPPECIDRRRGKGYQRQLGELYLTNGTVFYGFSAAEPDRLRGPQCHRLYGDELAAWDKPAGNAQYAYDMAAMGCRLGHDARMCFATTPKSIPLLFKLRKQAKEKGNVVITTGSTYDNIHNLAGNFKETILQYEGTRLGRQEIGGELLDLEEQGIISRKWIRMWPADQKLPQLVYIILSLDTAYTERQFDKKHAETDPTAGTVWGVFPRNAYDPNLLDNDVMLLDAWDEHLKLPDLVRRVHRERTYTYGPTRKGVDLVLIEDKGSGISLRQTLQEHGVVCYPYNPNRDSKLQRLHAVSPIFANRRVWIPESMEVPGEFRKWAVPLVEQVCSYYGPGTTEGDDYVDSTSQALKYLFDSHQLRTSNRIERDSEENDNVVPFKPKVNPYAA
jgi:predicted phage terminase large subunit-like protein